MQNPWGYELKVWDGFTYDTQQAVDLVETFNYLVGLHVQKWLTTERAGLKYVGVWGYNNDEKRIWVIWRNTTGWQEADYDADKAFIEAWVPAQPYEVLYVNHQCTVPGSLLTEEVFKTQMIPA
jgi:adenine-specific DNA-methyltransferase